MDPRTSLLNSRRRLTRSDLKVIKILVVSRYYRLRFRLRLRFRQRLRFLWHWRRWWSVIFWWWDRRSFIQVVVDVSGNDKGFVSSGKLSAHSAWDILIRRRSGWQRYAWWRFSDDYVCYRWFRRSAVYIPTSPCINFSSVYHYQNHNMLV